MYPRQKDKQGSYQETMAPSKQHTFYVPPGIKPELIMPNGKLLRDVEIAALEKEFKDKSIGRYSKSYTSGRYGVIKDVNGLYVIYRDWTMNSTPDKNTSDNSTPDKNTPDKMQYILGQGSFAAVKLVQHLATGAWSALKIQKLHPMFKLDIAKAEYKMLQHLKLSTGNEIERESKKTGLLKHHVIYQYSKGQTIFALMQPGAQKSGISKNWRPLLWLDIIIKIVEALLALHKISVLHCDIKLTNICFDIFTDELRLLDFGFAGLMDDRSRLIKLKSAGTRDFAAPEILHKKDFYEFNPKVEIYALGLVIQKIVTVVRVMRENFPQGSDLQKLYATMSAAEQKQRPDMEEVLKELNKIRQEHLQRHPAEGSLVAAIKAAAQLEEAQRLAELDPTVVALGVKAVERYNNRSFIFKWFSSQESLDKAKELEKQAKEGNIRTIKMVAEDYIRDHGERGLAQELMNAGFNPSKKASR